MIQGVILGLDGADMGHIITVDVQQGHAMSLLGGSAELACRQ